MAAAPPIEVGSTLGPYTILDVLGRGSQGVVYLAQKADSEPVALKVLRPDADLAARARFEREVEATTRVVHEGIVRVLDSGTAEGGLVFYAMERIDAPNLERRIVEQGALEARDAARLIAKVARAVQFAHELGVVHRDLKPANVLLAGGSLESPKITDFGLALVAGGTKLTQTNAFVGTPCYLAPEIIRGEKATAASDVYALGAVLYECLVGRPPFIGATLGAILEKSLREGPSPPRKVRPQVPAALERVCLQCLEKSPQHRPPGAGAVASALERFLGERRERGAGEAAREGLAVAWVSFLRAQAFLLGLALGILAGFHLGLWLAGLK